MQAITYRVFVYGTLRRGEVNAHYLDTAQYLGTQRAKGYQLRAYTYYPFAYFDPEGEIVGELYAVTSDTLARLDVLEDVENGLYLRHFDENLQAFVYVRTAEDRENFPLIPDGDWCTYTN